MWTWGIFQLGEGGRSRQPILEVSCLRYKTHWSYPSHDPQNFICPLLNKIPAPPPHLSPHTLTDVQTQQSIAAEDRLSKTKALWMKTKRELDSARKTEGELQANMVSLNAQLEAEKQLTEQNKVSSHYLSSLCKANSSLSFA